MPWKCPKCGLVNASLNTHCADTSCRCEESKGNGDMTQQEQVSISNTMNKKELFEYIESNAHMNEKEKKLAKFHYHEKVLVKDMDMTTLKAHIEELADVI